MFLPPDPVKRLQIPMRVLMLIPLIYLAAVLETSLADVIRVGQVGPDLLALVAMAWLLTATGQRSFLAAGAVGLASDLASPGRTGLAAACFLLVGYGVQRLRARLAIKHAAGQVAVVWAAVTLISTALALGRWLLGEAVAPPRVLLVRSLGVGVYTAGVSLPLWMVMAWLREPRCRRSVVA